MSLKKMSLITGMVFIATQLFYIGYGMYQFSTEEYYTLNVLLTQMPSWLSQVLLGIFLIMFSGRVQR